MGNRTVVTDANGHVTTYAYNFLDQLKRETNALDKSWWYAYDDAGHLSRKVDGEWQATYYEYDGAGRQTAITYGSTGQRVDFEYDAVSNRIAMTDTTGVTTYVYDALNRPLTVTSPLTGVVGYRYDAAGNRTRLIYPDPSAGSGQGGKVVTYTHDAANRLASIVDWARQSTTYAYDAIGRLVTETLPNGVRTVSTYDDAGRLTRLAHRRLDDGEILGNHRFALDEVGNRVVVTETLVVPTDTVPITTIIRYTYDPLNRLTGADYSNGYVFAYTYDAVGNRTTYTRTITDTRVTTYTYDAANRSTSVNGQAYTWDDNGNLLDDGSKTYTYDRAGRMVGVQGVSVTLVYTYNADGLRVAQSVSDTVTCTVTAFTWDLASPLAQVLSTSDGALNLYGLARIGELRDGEWAYPLGDAVGSVRQRVNSGGYVDYAAGYTPFGAELWQQGSTTSTWGYTGEWWDGDTGLLYLRARWYEPGVGRFTQRDVWPEDYHRSLTLNDYLYVAANPINYTDPSGLCLDADFDGICDDSEPDYRDLTDWLYREMIHNANDPTIRKLRAWNMIARGWAGTGVIACGVGWAAGEPIIAVGGGIVIVGGTVFHGTALYEYSQLVKDGARWDVKDEIGIKLGPGITLCPSGTCFNDIEYSVPGNIHFAYIGGAAGIFGWEIQAGAAWAEVHDPAHDPESPQYVGPYEGETDFGPTLWDSSTWNLGDEPMDHEAVTLGIKLWEKYKANMTRADFERELGSYISKLAHHEPRTKPVDPDVAKYYPYSVGYFNNKGNVYRGE